MASCRPDCGTRNSINRAGETMDIERDLKRIALQEERLRFEHFDPGIAWDLGLALKQAADDRGVGVALDISTASYTLFSHSMGGTSPDNAEWVRRKRNVTLRFHRSSYAIGLELQRSKRSLEEAQGLKGDNFMAHGGSFPIRLAGPTCIGAITVSGLPQREDHDLLTRTLTAFLGQDVKSISLAR
jgi:uncharacterized protein (UPF0303 family)